MQILNTKISNRFRKQKGVAVVESAIVLPLIIFIILIVGELGHAILQYNTLTQTVRNAARYIAEEAEANSGVITLTDAKIAKATNLLIGGTISSGPVKLPDLDLAVIQVLPVGGDSVSIEVAYNYQPIFFPNIPTLSGIDGAGGAFTMKTKIIMRIL